MSRPVVYDTGNYVFILWSPLKITQIKHERDVDGATKNSKQSHKIEFIIGRAFRSQFHRPCSFCHYDWNYIWNMFNSLVVWGRGAKLERDILAVSPHDLPRSFGPRVTPNSWIGSHGRIGSKLCFYKTGSGLQWEIYYRSSELIRPNYWKRRQHGQNVW